MRENAAAPAEAQAAPAAADTVAVRILSPSETAAYLAATPEAQVVDVRTPQEIAASGALAEAVVVDFTAPQFAERAAEALDPDRPVVLYCRSGNRAGQAARVLADLGYPELVNAGGFADLAAAGLDTEPRTP